MEELNLDVIKIYNRIKIRKYKQIELIESILSPIAFEHPEIKQVLDIIEKWKPKFGENNNEGNHLPKS